MSFFLYNWIIIMSQSNTDMLYYCYRIEFYDNYYEKLLNDLFVFRKCIIFCSIFTVSRCSSTMQTKLMTCFTLVRFFASVNLHMFLELSFVIRWIWACFTKPNFLLFVILSGFSPYPSFLDNHKCRILYNDVVDHHVQFLYVF